MTNQTMSLANAADRLRIIQGLRGLTDAGPTEATKERLTTLMNQPNIDPEMRKVVTMMMSSNPEVRAAISVLLTELSERATSAMLNELQMDTPVMGQIKTGGGTTGAHPTSTTAELVIASASTTETASAPVVEAEVFPLTDGRLPFFIKGELEIVSLQEPVIDGVEQPNYEYSIYRTDRAPDVKSLNHRKVLGIRGVVLGYKGQGDVPGGFGWVFPFADAIDFKTTMEDGVAACQPAKMHLRVAYPGPIPCFDEHAGLLPYASRYLAANELFHEGISLLMSVEVSQYNSMLVVTTSPAKAFDARNKDNTSMPVPLRHTDSIRYGFDYLEAIGVLLDLEPA